ncbi:ABC transporter [Candidatus Methylacidiphilum fumarolicum]|uniref:ABC-type transport system involved in gliding motility, auxiliary component n=2 Tax=Candidatus Methylacidiphilum fumarolicum TaxID=591154 RepID=I0K017_METFB|nr:GldG family protein [Candidatus Methylacidiphilum fumarolicum]MBW6415139.1 GldG family protein [Candidatus Methylacidiphilum fumarolicum]TFE65981.1 ABC transporter [Candidatus Methylacidiphilum fumarolicum]TFE72746.1 ABC transporter [Candidatus Methylacidiphilum fumarolicum]TFE73210.1 ABC transporter [Candidatus Methylacidiphilum fumarolicum]TFE77581.1 ABC transporter [Candidatus Methylacidiphilum fumarolicum]
MKGVTVSHPLRFQLRINNILTILLMFAIVWIVNYLGYKYYYRKDFSKGGMYTLSSKTINVLKSLPEPVKIIVCLTNSKLQSDIDNLLKEYKYYGGNKIIIEHIDPALNLERAEALAKRLKFDLQENVIIFEYKNFHKFVNDNQLVEYDNSVAMFGQSPSIKAFKGEQQFTAAILSVVEGKPSKVYFLTGHGERNIDNYNQPGGYGIIATQIRKENMEPLNLNLLESGAVPEDAAVVVIAGPKNPLSPSELQAITHYLDSKGKLIVLEGSNSNSGLEPLLSKYGIIFQNDKVVAIGRLVGGLGGEMLIDKAAGTHFADHPAVKPMIGYTLQLPDCRSIALSTDSSNPNVKKVTALVKTPEGFWGEVNWKEEERPKYDPGVDIPGPLILAAVYDGGEVPGKEGIHVFGTRIAAVGSSSFLANQNIKPDGVDFFINLLNWMLQKEMALGIAPKSVQEFGLSIPASQRQTVAMICLITIPFAFLVLGVGMYFSRRR